MTYWLTQRHTKQDWDTVESENPLCKEIRKAKRKVHDVLAGITPVAYIGGGAGVGKSRTITDAIHEAKKMKPHLQVLRARPNNFKQLANQFIAMKGKGILVLEECDHVFRSEASLDILKKATDDATGRQFTITLPPKKRGDPDRYVTVESVPIIFAFNSNPFEMAKDPKLGKHIEALWDREDPMFITADPEAWAEYTIYLALCHGLIRMTESRTKPIPIKVQNAAIKHFAETAWRQSSLSPRRLVKIAAKFLADYEARLEAERGGQPYDPRALKEDLEGFLIPHGETNPNVTTRQTIYAPEIFFTPKHDHTRAEDRIAKAKERKVEVKPEEPRIEPKSESTPAPKPGSFVDPSFTGVMRGESQARTSVEEMMSSPSVVSMMEKVFPGLSAKKPNTKKAAAKTVSKKIGTQTVEGKRGAGRPKGTKNKPKEEGSAA